jgi:hypothetical protein
MTAFDGDLICVQSGWKDWRTAEVRVRDLTGVHWLQPIGAPHALLHGYITCTSVVSGEIPHRCDGASAPHRLLVCALKRRTPPAAYAALARQADAAHHAMLVLPHAPAASTRHTERR